MNALYLEGNQLSGTLPHSLTMLSALGIFHFQDNAGLCAPIAESLRKWLSGITIKSGSVCPLGSPSEDRAALVALYNATDGPNWKESDNWLSDEPLDTWHGVVTNAGGRVTEVHLTSNRLSGHLPSELASLFNVTKLALARN